MKRKTKVLRFSCLLLFIFLMVFGCELPGGSSKSDTNTTSGTSGSGNTGGTGGTQTTGQINGTWNGTFQETSNNMPGTLGSGVLHFTFNQMSNSSFSGSGYFQRTSMPQANLNDFSNGMITGNSINFTATNGPASPLGSDAIQYNGILNGNTISGIFERTVVRQGMTTVIIKGNFSLSTGGTTTGTTTVNITGHWEGTYNDTMHSAGILGNGIISFDFVLTNSMISGHGVNSTLNGSSTVTNGFVSGNNVNFNLSEVSNGSYNQWTSVITNIAIVNGNIMTGTYKATTNLQSPSPHMETSEGNFTLNRI